MKNEIFVNVGPQETRVAVREQDRIVELHIERRAERGVAGGIYKGRVTRVLPGMQAAFVDIGLERAGFLYVTDYRADFDDVDLGDDQPSPNRRRGAAQRGRGPQIEDLLEEGREILVQVKKEPLGTKGARIESRISLAGRHLVLMPGAQRVGVSRRIDGERERRRLRKIVEQHTPDSKELGFIVRTVSHGVSEADIKADIDYLISRWDAVQKRTGEVDDVPALIYEEPPLHLRMLRDLVTHETKEIMVDDSVAYGEMQEFIRSFMAAPRPKITHYRKSQPLFDSQRIENEIEEGLGRKVFLKSGGSLVVDQSEALTAIDVNTGGFVGGKSRNLEETILKTNLEAVREIARQLRFRNIGGLIILDLIDMEVHSNRDKVYRALQEALREDKAKVNSMKISDLGLVEMTRKRTRENLMQQLCDPCPTCEGKGYLQSAVTVANKIYRELPKATEYLTRQTLTIAAHPDVIEHLGGENLETLQLIEKGLGRTLELEARASLHQEQFEITAKGDRIEVQPTAEVEVEAAPEPVSEESTPAVEEPVEAAAEEAPATEPAAAAEDTSEARAETATESQTAAVRPMPAPAAAASGANAETLSPAALNGSPEPTEPTAPADEPAAPVDEPVVPVES